MQPDNPIVGGTVLRRPAIQSPNYSPGVSGWAIFADGTAEFNNVTIRSAVLINTSDPAITVVIAIRTNTDTTDRIELTNDGRILFGSGGVGGPDATIEWNAAAQLKITPNLLVDENLTVGGQGFAGQLEVVASLASAIAYRGHLGTEATDRWAVLGDGTQQWSDGTNAADINLSREAAGTLKLDSNLHLSGSGKGLQLKLGTNQRTGEATLVAGTVTVANTTVTASTAVLLSRHTAGGTLGHLAYSRVVGTSFTITSSSATDTSTVIWVLVEQL